MNILGLISQLIGIKTLRLTQRTLSKRKELEDRRFESSKNKVSKPDYSNVNQKNVGSSSGQDGQPKSFTPLNMSIDLVFLQIQDNPALKWPKKLRSSPIRRFKNLYCRFHGDHDHNTEDCSILKEQIEALIRQGKLKKFVLRDNQETRPPR